MATRPLPPDRTAMTPTHRKIGLTALVLGAVALLFVFTPMSKAFNSPADDCLDYYRSEFINDVDLVSSSAKGDGVTLIEMRGDHRTGRDRDCHVRPSEHHRGRPPAEVPRAAAGLPRGREVGERGRR